ncbi:TetR/AcrR family transcriptional regulator [Catenuloplanes atrovinosus]|uniref:TetR/AcrR family transcriptional repressor of mexJK operon n=1 Tax=Catenuloplanes atrovinosus TaxID=137266 RepID=A0AAE3YPT9_9ACTN|nr:TetR/AcrR family transcriptional regulator [Catenuloplanes atrovinosus]MDR7277027.1 TetR/AcrR family transcriptional repressor of mexJK operon [Catenuloplanes atrovinosus]
MRRIIAEEQTPGRRRRSEEKKTAILDAAENLFITDGYERTTVDAVAARAQVSKRTLYNHFSDKEIIFLRVLGRVHESLLGTIRAAVDEELTTGRDLREALTTFAHRIVDRAFGSADYLTYRRLTAQPQAVPRPPEGNRGRPLSLLEQRFAELAADGRIRAPRPRVAARHFTALTISLAQEALMGDQDDTGPADLDDIIADGVDAFLRAYGAGS